MQPEDRLDFGEDGAGRSSRCPLIDVIQTFIARKRQPFLSFIAKSLNGLSDSLPGGPTPCLLFLQNYSKLVSCVFLPLAAVQFRMIEMTKV